MNMSMNVHEHVFTNMFVNTFRGPARLFEVDIRLCSELAAVALQRQFRLEESRCAAVPVRLSDTINLTVRLIQVHGDFGLR